MIRVGSIVLGFMEEQNITEEEACVVKERVHQDGTDSVSKSENQSQRVGRLALCNNSLLPSPLCGSKPASGLVP